MKQILLVICAVVALVGCGGGKDKQSTNTSQSNNTPEKSAKKKAENETPSKGDDNNGTTAKLVKELTLRERVVGTYENKKDGNTFRAVFLENGASQAYENGEKNGEGKWSIVDGEIHIVIDGGREVLVSRINKDSSVTFIAEIDTDGERTDFPKDKQVTLKKIK